MQALVHFTVGLAGALAVLVVVDWPPRREFLVTYLSGVWAMVPDGHWMLREVGLDGPATAWRAVHGTAAVNVFWFHHLVDSVETGRANLEAGVSLLVLFVVVFGYYWLNDWTPARAD